MRGLRFERCSLQAGLFFPAPFIWGSLLIHIPKVSAMMTGERSFCFVLSNGLEPSMILLKPVLREWIRGQQETAFPKAFRPPSSLPEALRKAFKAFQKPNHRFNYNDIKRYKLLSRVCDL